MVFPNAWRTCELRSVVFSLSGSYEYRFYATTRMIQYRPVFTQQPRVKRKLKKGDDKADVELIVQRDVQATTEAPALSAAELAAPASNSAQGPPEKRQRIQTSVCTPEKWSKCDRSRLGARHEKVRAESYCDLSEEVMELRELRTQAVEELSKSRDYVSRGCFVCAAGCPH